MIELIERHMPKCVGYTNIFSFNPETGDVSQMVSQKNTIMDGMARVIAELLKGNAEYAIGSMYFEFENLSTPSADPAPPAFSKDEGVEYYTGLSYSGDTDFLRVPVIAQPVTTVNSAGSYIASFYAVTPGDEEGFWGKAFNEANNSAVFGGALVATPTPAVQANDVVAARNYPTGAKVLKPSGEQIAMTWNIEVKLP